MTTMLLIFGWLCVGFISGISIHVIDIIVHILKEKQYYFSINRFIQDMVFLIAIGPFTLFGLMLCIVLIIAEAINYIVSSSIFNPIRYKINSIDARINEVINGKER